MTDGRTHYSLYGRTVALTRTEWIVAGVSFVVALIGVLLDLMFESSWKFLAPLGILVMVCVSIGGVRTGRRLVSPRHQTVPAQVDGDESVQQAARLEDDGKASAPGGSVRPFDA